MVLLTHHVLVLVPPSPPPLLTQPLAPHVPTNVKRQRTCPAGSTSTKAKL